MQKTQKCVCGKKRESINASFWDCFQNKTFYVFPFEKHVCYFGKAKVFLCTKRNRVPSDCHLQAKCVF